MSATEKINTYGAQITRTTRWTGTELTVGVMRKLIEGADDADTINARRIEGDRPYESGYYTVEITNTERQK